MGNDIVIGSVVRIVSDDEFNGLIGVVESIGSYKVDSTTINLYNIYFEGLTVNAEFEAKNLEAQ